MDGVTNFRGIGGLSTLDGRTTAGGLLWRSGHLAGTSEVDRDRLEALGIRTVAVSYTHLTLPTIYSV